MQRNWNSCTLLVGTYDGMAKVNNSATVPQKVRVVVQWLRICLPMQGTRVQSLVQEDLTRHRDLSPCATPTEAPAP